jgi:hypothetical protein
MNFKKYFSLSCCFIVLFIPGCSTVEKPDLGSFDSELFISDRNACEEKRINQIDELRGMKEKILGLSETQIKEGFGRYDYQILDRRSEKIVFFLEKGPQCEQIQQPSNALVMELHINAVGLVKEVDFRRGNPAE